MFGTVLRVDLGPALVPGLPFLENKPVLDIPNLLPFLGAFGSNTCCLFLVCLFLLFFSSKTHKVLVLAVRYPSVWRRFSTGQGRSSPPADKPSSSPVIPTSEALANPSRNAATPFVAPGNRKGVDSFPS